MPIETALTADNLFAAGTIALAIGLVLAGALHIYNLNKVHKLMVILQKKTVSKSNLYKEMTVAQGSNFTALALTSWIMLFVAIAFLYLLVPTVLPFSYMKIAELASNPMGFTIFGLSIALLVAIIILFVDKLPEDLREFKLTELYSFYSISKATKKMIGLATVLLSLSVILSAYLGTIYPSRSSSIEFISLLLIIASAFILIMPIYKESWVAIR
ncbi:MAG: hypothetical protein A4E49_01482 [Methanosaeta sp. PtaU1.Bin112]|nr:MAG: hypothetical protein A4E49_01482 [Methanosaeta sp. PtaU1.Bin112]